MKISITKQDLVEALIVWESKARRGETLTREETLALTCEEVAADSADYLWNVLSSQVNKPVEPTEAVSKHACDIPGCVACGNAERSGFDTLPDDYETGDY